VRLQIALWTVAWIGCQAGCQAPLGESSAEQATILSPLSHDFGTLQTGMTSGLYQVVVSPSAGNQSDTITAVTASCPDFVIGAPGLPALVYRTCEVVTCVNVICPVANALCQTTELQTYTFDTYFRPTVAGTVSCVVTVTTANAANSRTLTLTGTGQPPPIHVDVQPGSVAFGDVRRNTDSTQAVVTVRSTGGQTLTVSSVSLSAGFTTTGLMTGYQLAPNASQSYPILCHPTAIGALAGQLVVSSNDPAQPTVAVPLSCRGIDSNLDIAPSPAVLATTRVGEPIDTVIDLRNTGGAAMTLESVAITGTGITMTSAPPPNTVLAAVTGVARVGVHFEASAKGDASSTLVVSYDGGQSRTTEISARALATSMALTPDGDIDFGPICGGQSKMQEFTLIANEQGAFSLTSIADPGAPFTIAMPALPVTVLGAGAKQVKFQVTASPPGEGVANAAVVVKTDIPNATDHTLNLTVQGLPPGVTATPAAVDLGSNPVNTTTIGQEVHLSNCGTAPIMFTNPRIEGTDALDFAIVAQPSSATIAPTGLASWLIVLQAHSVGPKQASFAVDYDGGTASIELGGEGLGDLGPSDDGRGSYYACSTGHPAALWPLAIALVVVVRRRRARSSRSRSTR